MVDDVPSCGSVSPSRFVNMLRVIPAD